MAIFTIIIFVFFAGLVYVILLLLTKLVLSFRIASLKADKKYKLTLLCSAFTIAVLSTYFFLFTSPATNYKTAYIEKEQQHYKLTVKGKRLYIVHDPVSLFLRKTCEDSAQYIIPRSEGIIKGHELPAKEGYYKSAGDIIVKGKHLKIDLYADNYNDKTLDPNTWNGNYNLVWRQK